MEQEVGRGAISQKSTATLKLNVTNLSDGYHRNAGEGEPMKSATSIALNTDELGSSSSESGIYFTPHLEPATSETAGFSEQTDIQSAKTVGSGARNYERAKSSEDDAMQEVESFLDSIIPIGRGASLGNGRDSAEAFVNSPSEMHDSDHMEVVEDDPQRRRESQIWEGAFDNTPRTSRKRKRAERHEQDDPASGRSTESPSTDSVQSDDEIIPGTLAFSFGPPNPTILTLTFEINKEQAAAAARWTLRTKHTEISDNPRQWNAHLQCISRSKLHALKENLALAASPTTAVVNSNEIYPSPDSDWSHLEPFSVWVEFNESSWTPSDLENQNSALNITDSIKPGSNELNIVSLTDISDFAFIVRTSTPSAAQRQETLANKQKEKSWDNLRSLGRGLVARLPSAPFTAL